MGLEGECVWRTLTGGGKKRGVRPGTISDNLTRQRKWNSGGWLCIPRERRKCQRDKEGMESRGIDDHNLNPLSNTLQSCLQRTIK